MRKLLSILSLLTGLSISLNSQSQEDIINNFDNLLKSIDKDHNLNEKYGTESLPLDKGEINKRIKKLKSLSEIHAEKGAFDSAFYFLVKYDSLKNILLSIQESTELIGTEAKKNSKTLKIKLNELNIEKKEEASKTFSLILVFLLGTGIFTLILIVLRKKNKESKDINEHLERKNRLIEKKNNEILDSILYAKKIQDAMLTSRTYIDNIFKEHLILYNPKDIISGDFYWAYNNERSKTLYWATVDCTGHGVPGALMSMIGTVLLNESVIIKKETDPDRVLTQMNQYLKRYINKTDSLYQTQDGMDISFCKLNNENLTLETAGANQSIYILRDRELKELKGDKITLGQDPLGREVKEFSVKTYPLKSNDLIYTFTDGFTDQIGGPNKKKFKIGALKNLLVEISDLPMEKQKEQLKHTLSNWKSGYPQLDDILIMGVKV